jgi:hypothetical protein
MIRLRKDEDQQLQQNRMISSLQGMQRKTLRSCSAPVTNIIEPADEAQDEMQSQETLRALTRQAREASTNSSYTVTDYAPVPRSFASNGKNRRRQDAGIEILFFTDYHGMSRIQVTAKRRGLKTVLAARRGANKPRQLTQSAIRASAIFCIFFRGLLLRRSSCARCGYFGIQCTPPSSHSRETFRGVRARGAPESRRFVFSISAFSCR